MTLSDEQLILIQEYSSLFLSPREISCLIDFDFDVFSDLLFDKSSPAFLAYYRGKTISKLELRRKVVPLAKLGSPQAQNLTEEYIRTQQQEELFNE